MRIRDEDFSLPPFPKLCSMHDGLRRRLKFEKNDHGLPKVATRNIIKNLLFLGLREREREEISTGTWIILILTSNHVPSHQSKHCPTCAKRWELGGWRDQEVTTHTHLFPARCNARKRFFCVSLLFFAVWKRVEKRNIHGNSAARKSGKYGELSVFLLLLQRRKWQILQKGGRAKMRGNPLQIGLESGPPRTTLESSKSRSGVKICLVAEKEAPASCPNETDDIGFPPSKKILFLFPLPLHSRNAKVVSFQKNEGVRDSHFWVCGERNWVGWGRRDTFLSNEGAPNWNWLIVDLPRTRSSKKQNEKKGINSKLETRKITELFQKN